MWAKIVDYFVRHYLIKFLTTLYWQIVQHYKDKIDKAKRDKEQLEAREKFEKLDPNASLEEKAKAYEDMINSGRKP